MINFHDLATKAHGGDKESLAILIIEAPKGMMGNLSPEEFAKIQQFFVTMPRLKHVVNLTHPKTKKKGKVVLEGLQSFF